MAGRDHISLTTRLAAALLALGDVPHDDAKLMTAAQIISLYQFDHYPIRHADGGASEPWNLVPRLIVPHRAKTAKIDRPQMAKRKRIIARTAEFNRRMAAKAGQGEATSGSDPGTNIRPWKRRWPKRPMR